MSNEMTAGHHYALAERARHSASEDPPGYASGAHAAQLDGSRFGRFVRENYKLFLIVMAVVLGLAALYTWRQDPVYETSASVLLDQRKKQVVQGLEEVVSPLPADSSVVDTEVELLSSSGMAFQVARKAGLIPNTPIPQMSHEQQEEAALVVRELLENRTIRRVGLTYLIEIRYRSTDPELAQQIANLFATTYLESQVGVRVQENERVRRHLESEIAELRSRVKNADAAVAAYKARTGLNGNTAAGTLTEQEISSYNQTLALARAQAAEDAQRLNAARSQMAGGADKLGELNTPSMANLRAQQATASALVAQLASRYGPNHPELITARGQLEDINRLISGQGSRVVSGLEAQAQASAGRAAEIAAKLASTQSNLAGAGTAAVRLRELEAELAAPKTLLDAYMARLAQISTQSGLEQPDARIVAFAPFPVDPSGPSWLVNMVIGAVLGGILFVILALVRQVFAVGVGSPEEVESTFGVEFLAAVPRLRNDDDMAIINHVVEAPNSPYAESLRALAAGLFVPGQEQPRVIAFTSPQASEGKSTTAIAFGRSQALRGRRVLVIDCDLQRPSFHSRFGLGQLGKGLVEVLRGEASLADGLVSDSLTSTCFLPAGEVIEPGESIAFDQLNALIADARTQFDLVVLDLPPVLQVAEARVIAAVSDGVVLLTRWKHTSRQAIEFAITLLARAGNTVLGLVLTEVPVTSDILMGSYGEAGSSNLRLAES
ncbi:polysaccharide biosynthesis tyrosine autokinase [Novosphingobium sp. RD2P27]|uniref:non-specific protein-tyrosine kinase n=1 Tax=Novosphingobium kalidii TaxID=3230299 RepID=A0ABV2CXT2_9SPHN